MVASARLHAFRYSGTDTLTQLCFFMSESVALDDRDSLMSRSVKQTLVLFALGIFADVKFVDGRPAKVG